MKWFYNLKISLKLLIGFLLVAVIAVIIGVIGIINLNQVNKEDKALYELNTVPLEQIANISIAYRNTRVSMRDLFIDKNISNRNNHINLIDDNLKVMNEKLNLFSKTLQTGEGKEVVAALKNSIDNYGPYIHNLVDLVKAEKGDQAYNLMQTKGLVIAKEIDSQINKLFELKLTLAKQKSESNTATTNMSIQLMFAVILIGIILAIGLGIFISQIISKPLKELVNAADKIAIGDVNVVVHATSNDEIGRLMGSFDNMIQNIREQALIAEKIATGDLTVDVKVKSENDLLGLKLREMVEKNNEVLGNINNASEQVSAGSKQVSISSQTLSQGSTEQASSIEEITSSMTEVAAQTKQNAVNANQANELAMAAKDSAIEGNQQMKGMLKAMEEINDASGNISKIIKVIDEIAFQTNILALNAAVEAARAGQHGKGFAVVAEEVRNLAARSANAAKETTTMIEGSIKKVEAGTKIANETAQALNKIVGNVTGATNLVAEIAAASNQQASAITQINQGIEQVSQVIQSNTATAEESASASEELSSQAELLKNMVAQFKIRKNQVLGQLNGVSFDMIKALEDLVAKKGSTTHNHQLAMAEASPTGGQSKIKIHLDDTEFGKY